MNVLKQNISIQNTSNRVDPVVLNGIFTDGGKINTVYGQITRRNSFQSNAVPSNDWNNICCEFESRSGRGVQHYVIKFVSDMRQVDGFLRVFRFPPPIKLTNKQMTLIKYPMEVTERPGENHRPVAYHWQTLLHNVVHLALIEIRTHNIYYFNRLKELH
jgi:hypothetical protein